MDSDATLTRWSKILLLLAVATALQSVAEVVALFLGDGPIVLARGGELWRTSFGELPAFETTAVAAIVLGPQLAWVFVAFQVGKLAVNYRRGNLFDASASRCFLRIGAGLAVMGALDTLAYPALNHLFYWRGISPWLANQSVLAELRLDLIMAGAFFFILGKIMTRGAELQDLERFTV